MKPLLLPILMLFLFPPFTLAENKSSDIDINHVFVEKGNIYFSPDGKSTIQLTKSGKDRAPVLSPDGKIVAFIRKSYEEAYLTVGGEEDYGPEHILADQIWIVSVNDKKEKILVKDRKPNERNWKGEEIIAHIDDESLQFSPDGKRVYFITSAWVTSGAIHSVNIDGSDEHFVTAGNSLKVIDKGRYKGDLIVRQHRYFLAGGSYDWLWLFSPEGEEIGALGIDLEQGQLDFLYADGIKEQKRSNK